jgi:hypothetical protein
MENDKDGSLEAKIQERYLLGKCAAVIEDIKPAKQIVDEVSSSEREGVQWDIVTDACRPFSLQMVDEAVKALQGSNSLVVGGQARL